MPIQSPALNKLVISSGNMDLRYTYVPSFFWNLDLYMYAYIGYSLYGDVIFLSNEIPRSNLLQSVHKTYYLCNAETRKMYSIWLLGWIWFLWSLLTHISGVNVFTCIFDCVYGLASHMLGDISND